MLAFRTWDVFIIVVIGHQFEPKSHAGTTIVATMDYSNDSQKT